MVSSSLGGISFGVDSEGNYGYYKYDETAGADTLVPFKSGKQVVYLGAGTSFNVSSYEGYQNFTTDNFIVGANSGHSSQGASGKYTCNPKIEGFTISKSYNASSGVLSITGNYQTAGTVYTNSGSWCQTVTQTMSCFAYLVY